MGKRLMILGGSRYIVPVIEAAHELDIEVITADYLPNNIAHAHSDRYCNVSVIDKEAVLACAEDLRIDGIMSFACDPGVVTAAYVAEKMGLPFQGSYESVRTLQDKGLFRAFLQEHGFNCPHAKRFTDPHAPLKDVDFFNWPVMVKPADSAGSKGCVRVDSPSDVPAAAENALTYSASKGFIVEDFLTFEGYHSSADPFTVNGNLDFVSYSDQLFDPDADNPYTPALIIWPSTMDQQHQDLLTSETQRLMTLLNMRTGIYNIESCVGAGGIPYIMEVSPRGGGCKIAELQKLAYGIDLIDAEVRQSIGLPVADVRQTACDGVWCEMVVHARPGESGVLESISIASDVRERYLRVEDISARPGDVVEPFTGANMALGDIFLRFENRNELDDVVSYSHEWLNITLR